MSIMRALKHRVKEQVLRGRFRPVTGVVYDSVIKLELGFQRIIDGFCSEHMVRNHSLLGHLTAVVKTFERPRSLKRLIDSIRRKYASLKIIVVDDSRKPRRHKGVEMVVLPYDSGVSAGRREGLRRVRTKYVLMLDDDYVFFRRTSLEQSLALMERHPKIDIIGGEVIDLPFYRAPDYAHRRLFPRAYARAYTSSSAIQPAERRIGGLPVYDMVPNFFVGRTERIRLIDWDPLLKRIDHADFFTRAKGTLTTVFNKQMKCLHARTLFDAGYMKKRQKYRWDAAVLHMRYCRNKPSGKIPGIPPVDNT
jgi:glycosyltransferase involved in cell wall biosynthesis